MRALASFLIAVAAESWEILLAMRDGWREGMRPVERPELLR